jgi:FolB domain-containing protein
MKTRLGVDASERKNPQDCEADIVVWGNSEPGASTDDLSHVIDYAKILSKVLEIADGREYALLETLACSITSGVLQEFPVTKVLVKVRKRPVALLDKLDYVEVEIEECR